MSKGPVETAVANNPPDVWTLNTPANGETMYEGSIKKLKDNIETVAKAVDDLPSAPTKTSELENDAGFITSSDIPSVPTKTSELQNDSGFITAQEQADWTENNKTSPAYIKNNPFFARFNVPTYTITAQDITNGYCIIPVRIWPADENMPEIDELIWFIEFSNLSWTRPTGTGSWMSDDLKDIVDSIKMGFCDENDDWIGGYEESSQYGPPPLGIIENSEFDQVPGYPVLLKPINAVRMWDNGRKIQGISFKVLLKSEHHQDLAEGDKIDFDGHIRVLRWGYIGYSNSTLVTQ